MAEGDRLERGERAIQSLALTREIALLAETSKLRGV